MKPSPPDLRAGLAGADACLLDWRNRVCLADAAYGNPLSVAPQTLDGAHILLRTQSQLSAALALIALDGVAARLVIAPPDLADAHLPGVIERANLDTLVTDGKPIAGLRPVTIAARPAPAEPVPSSRVTEWVLFTSGTTGAPKMVTHNLAGLTGAIRPTTEKIVWGTFYDIRRYGGLQILLRALLGRASLILSQVDEPVGDFLTRLGRHKVTHLTGTPSHWRRAVMSPAIGAIAPRYVRLSGEIADQAVLDSLKARFPGAAIGHAYASTEAGVGFEVTDGREGFPAEFVGRPGAVEMKVVDGVLNIRSARAATRYIGSAQSLGENGFVDTGDMVELRRSVRVSESDRNDESVRVSESDQSDKSVRASESDQSESRYYFVGRRGGIINVGGLKIHPEEVEAVINCHPAVRLSRVSGRKSPITGALVVADVVLQSAGAANDNHDFREEILSFCRARLPAFKVPAMVRIVDRLELTAGGKLARPHG